MSSVNKAIILGRLGKDPETKFTPGGLQITNFSVATSKNYKIGDDWREKTEWHNIVMFNNQAENAAERLKKGNMVYIEGEIQTRSWEDDKGGKHYKTEIVGNMFRNLSPKEESSQSNQQPPQPKQDNGKDLPF